MGAFRIRRHTPLPPVAAFRAVTDFPGHARGVPLTRVETDPGTPRVGWGFRAVTALGPVRLVDPMVLTRWNPPGEDGAGGYGLRKTGRVLGGWAEVDVVADRRGGSEVRWVERVDVRPRLRRPLAVPVPAPLGRLVFARALQALLERAERGQAS